MMLPSYAWKFSMPEIFWNTEGFPYEFFWHRETKKIQRKIVMKWNMEIRGGIDVCRKPAKTRFQTAVSFLTNCKRWSKYLYSGEKYAGGRRRLVLFFIA